MSLSQVVTMMRSTSEMPSSVSMWFTECRSPQLALAALDAISCGNPKRMNSKMEA